MAGAPPYKVYSADREYLAAFWYAEDAAAVVSLRGDGTTIRYGHKIVVWTEGAEECPASESYDVVARTVHERSQAAYR